jgi:RNA-binding protein
MTRSQTPIAAEHQPEATDSATRRRLKRIAHHLEPIVLIGDQGVTEAVIAETARALEDHELIKVRIHGADRSGRQALASQLAEACQAVIIQSIGKVSVLFRKNPHPNLRLSNLARFS